MSCSVQLTKQSAQNKVDHNRSAMRYVPLQAFGSFTDRYHALFTVFPTGIFFC